MLRVQHSILERIAQFARLFFDGIGIDVEARTRIASGRWEHLAPEKRSRAITGRRFRKK
jgi:hypothetical protein